MGAFRRARLAAGIVTGLGKNRGTVVHLSFETGGKGRRVAGELYWRKPELKGRDKPKVAIVPPPGADGYAPSREDYEARIASEQIGEVLPDERARELAEKEDHT